MLATQTGMHAWLDCLMRSGDIAGHLCWLTSADEQNLHSLLRHVACGFEAHRVVRKAATAFEPRRESQSLAVLLIPGSRILGCIWLGLVTGCR